MKLKLAEGTPRLQGMPWTAPRYDELTKKAVYVPVPTSCIQIVIDGKDNCTCYFEKVKLATAPEVCHSFVKDGGLFVDFEVPRHKSQEEAAVKGSTPSPGVAAGYVPGQVPTPVSAPS